MPRTTIALGSILVVIGVISWLASSLASWTALIPSILGAALIVCGLIAQRRQKLGIHLALVIALAGMAGTLMNVLKIGELFAGTAERPLAVIASTLTFALLLVYLVIGVRSFLTARRWKSAEQPSA